MTASGDWGLITEPPQSGEHGVVTASPNILLNANLFAELDLQPQVLSLGGPGGYGPFTVLVSLTEVRPSAPSVAG